MIPGPSFPENAFDDSQKKYRTIVQYLLVEKDASFSPAPICNGELFWLPPTRPWFPHGR